MSIKINTEINYQAIFPRVLLDFANACRNSHSHVSSLDAHLTASIAFVAGLIGNTIRLTLRNGYGIYPNTYSLIIGVSGQGKSSYIGSSLEILSSIKMSKNEEHKILSKKRFAEKKKLEGENKLRTKQGLEPHPPLAQSDYPEGVFNTPYPFYNSDFTVPALQQGAANTSFGNIFVVKDEMGAIFNSFKKVAHSTDLAFLNEMYECYDKAYTVVRKTKDAKIPEIHNLCGNILGAIQHNILNKYLKHYADEGDGDGFCARFQNISILPPGAGIPNDLEKQPQDKLSKENYQKLIEELVENLIPYSKLPVKERTPRHLTLSFEAEGCWKLFQSEIAEILKSTKDDLFIEYLSKSCTFSLKIAVIFFIAKNIKNKFENEIDVSTMNAAIIYTKMKIEDAKKLYGIGTFTVDKNTSLVTDRLLDYLIDSESKFYKEFVETGFSISNLARTHIKILPRNRNKIDDDYLKQILDFLCDKDELFCIDYTHPISKTVTFKYYLNPKYIKNPYIKEGVNAKYIAAKFTAEIAIPQLEKNANHTKKNSLYDLLKP